MAIPSMLRRNHFSTLRPGSTLLMGLLVSACAQAAFSQSGDRGSFRDRYRDRGDSRDRGSYRERGDYRDRGDYSRREFSFESLDANGDGLLQESELPERMRDRFREMGERAGVKPGEAIPLSSLRSFGRRREGDDSRRENSGANASTAASVGGENPAAAAPMSDASATTSAESSTVTSAKVDPLVPGFGAETTFAAVPGFGVPADLAQASPRSAASTPTAKTSTSATSAASAESLERVKRYALSLMRQYDKNNNNVLEPDEWKEMRGDPAQADANKDGIITLDELTQRLATYGQRREAETRGGDSNAASNSSSASATPAGKFLPRSKPLPPGLPSWFATRDKDGDGQVSMAEYATTWTEQLAAEFRRYDQNNDGIITAREALNPASGSATAAASMSSGSNASNGATPDSNSGASSSSSSSATNSSGFGRSSSGGYSSGASSSGYGDRRRGFGSRD